VKYSFFCQFLKENCPEVYSQITNQYTFILKKIYFQNFKSYIIEMHKLIVDPFTKNDLLYPEKLEFMKSKVQTKGLHLK